MFFQLRRMCLHSKSAQSQQDFCVNIIPMAHPLCTISSIPFALELSIEETQRSLPLRSVHAWLDMSGSLSCIRWSLGMKVRRHQCSIPGSTFFGGAKVFYEVDFSGENWSLTNIKAFRESIDVQYAWGPGWGTNCPVLTAKLSQRMSPAAPQINVALTLRHAVNTFESFTNSRLKSVWLQICHTILVPNDMACLGRRRSAMPTRRRVVNAFDSPLDCSGEIGGCTLAKA